MLTLKVAVRTLKNIVCECPAPTGRRMQKGSQSFVFCSSWPGNFELDLTRHFDDVLWTAFVLEESVFQSFSAVDKKPPNAPRVSRATQLPARFLPTKTIAPIWVVSYECELSSEQSVMVIQVLDSHSSDCDPAVLRLAIGKRMSDLSCYSHRKFETSMRLQSFGYWPPIGSGLAWAANIPQAGGIAQTATEFYYQF